MLTREKIISRNKAFNSSYSLHTLVWLLRYYRNSNLINSVRKEKKNEISSYKKTISKYWLN